MTYQVRNYLKKHCTDEYTIEELDTLAENMSNDSDGKYTAKASLKILCRYVCVKDGKITFDPQSRNFDQTYDVVLNKLKTSYNSQSKTPIKSPVKSSAKTGSKTPIKAQPIVKKGGFGKFTSKIVNNDSDGEDTNDMDQKAMVSSVLANPKKTSNQTTAKPVIKTGGFGKINKTIIKKANDDDDYDINTNKNNKTQDKKTSYLLGSPKKYEGDKRTDPLYGPYGTDNFFDTNMKDDDIDDSIKHRIETFRKLASREYPAQRSKEWFELRDQMITASDGGTIVNMNPYEKNFDFIIKKVFGKPFETSEDCYHGKKYEQVATDVYMKRMNVYVKEFGLCQHPKYKFLGASPDGIVSEYKLKTKDGRLWEEIEKEADNIEDYNDKVEFYEAYGYKTQYVGRMLEIKCPMRRKILMDEDAAEVYGPHGEPITDLKKDSKRGICPSYYWVQVQLQLECCELDECDFWQCEIFEYGDREDFLDDTDPDHPWLSRQTGHEKGALIQLMPYDQVNNQTMKYNDRIYNFAQFIYQPRLDMTPSEVDDWVLNTIENIKTTHKGMIFESVKYWKVINTRSITIKRDDQWIKDNLSVFKHSWDCVEYFRSNKDKANLLNRYLKTFPLDCYKKIKEPLKNKGIIFETINKIVNEPPDDAPDREHKKYAQFIAGLEKEIEDADIELPKEYDVNDDIKYIIDMLKLDIPKDLPDDEKEEHNKKFIEYVKLLKHHTDAYLFTDGPKNTDTKSNTKTNINKKNIKPKILSKSITKTLSKDSVLSKSSLNKSVVKNKSKNTVTKTTKSNTVAKKASIKTSSKTSNKK